MEVSKRVRARWVRFEGREMGSEGEVEEEEGIVGSALFRAVMIWV